MNPDQGERVADLFESCRLLPKAERDIRLAALGPLDEEVRREVLSLLQAYDGSPDFLNQPALEHHSGILKEALQPHEGRASEIGDFRGTPRFQILRRLGAGGMGVVYEAYDCERKQPVALKTLQHLSAEAIFRFKREFRSLAEMVHPNLVSLYELFFEDDQWFFTMELIGDGAPFPAAPFALDERTPGSRSAADLKDAFRQLTEGVQALHAAGKLHRDLKPANVLRRSNGRVVILDMGLVLERDTLSSKRAAPNEADSGSTSSRSSSGYEVSRMAGTLAYMSPEQAAGEELSEASDWYAVGVMLFEALTGVVPFERSAFDILARKQQQDAPSPDELATGVPEDLSRLCKELLSRDPKARPSGREILIRLAGGEPLSAGGTLYTAPDDVFVGRKAYLHSLCEAFEQTLRGRPIVVLLHAKSGSGKTALLETFLRQIAPRDGTLVLRSRCYEQESVPFKAVDGLVDALSSFLCRIPQSVAAELIPPGISALAKVFPALTRSRVVEQNLQQGAVPADLGELRRIAFAAFRELLLRTGERFALALAIDDLQWGDADSAALLLELIGGARPPRLLLVACYRSEHAETSACIRSLAALRIDEPVIVRMPVEAFSKDETRELMMQLSAQQGSAPSEADVEWIVQQSAGSPYFVHELVRSVRSGEGKMYSGTDLDAVLCGRVEQLPRDARKLLEVIAISGQPIKLGHALEAAELGSSPPHLIAVLRSQRMVRSTGSRLDDEIETYHDRIRESTVDALAVGARKAHHFRLAACLETADGIAPEILAYHFQRSDQPDKAAHNYESGAANAARALAFERAEDLYQRALALHSSKDARAQVAEKLVHVYTDLGRYQDAYDTGRLALVPYGMKLPAKYQPATLLFYLAECWIRFRRRTIAGVAQMRTAEDPAVYTMVRILVAAERAAHQLRPELCIILAARAVNLSLRSGNTPDCAIGYMALGCIFVGGILGRHREGFEFGRLTLRLVEKYDNRRQRAEAHFAVGYFGTYWLRPAQEAEQLWQIAYDAALESHDLFHFGTACAATVMSQYMRGVPLEEVWAKSEDYVQSLRRFSLHELLGAVQAVRQGIRNLRGETISPVSLSSPDFDEVQFEEGLSRYGARNFAHYYFIVKMQVLYMRGEYDQAMGAMRSSETYVSDSRGMPHSAEHCFYSALILVADYEQHNSTARFRSLTAVRKMHRSFRKWMKDCPDNFFHKERILAGEMLRVAGDAAGSLRAYAEAVEAARRFRYLHVEGLAHQLAARVNARTGRHSEAAELERARDCYRQWGATHYAAVLD